MTMAPIVRIDARITTGNRAGAGTDGTVYLGLCGREFKLDSAVNDFEQGSDRTYILGEGGGAGSSVTNPAGNDPRFPQLDTANLDLPKYVRFEPSGNNPDWNLEFASATVNPGPHQLVFTAPALAGNLNLWLGTDFGKACFLK